MVVVALGVIVVVVDVRGGLGAAAAVVALKWRGGQPVILVHGHAYVVPYGCGGWWVWGGVSGEGGNVSSSRRMKQV